MDRYVAMGIFVKVAELKSFTRASEILGIPKAAATTAVQDLELLTQAKLLNRTTRTVELTPEGLSCLERCKDILSDMDEVESMFQIGSTQLKGKIRIDMVSTIAKDVVIPNLPKFYELYPEIEIEVVGSDRKLDLIREGIDCTIRSGDIEPGLGAVEINVGKRKIVNAVSPSYIKKYGKPKKLEDLKNHRLIHYVQNFGEKPDGFEYFDGEKTVKIKMKGMITVGSVDAYKAACLAGLGIIQNPYAGVREYLKSGELVEVLPKFQSEVRGTLKIVYPQKRFLSKRVRAFIEWVEPLLKKHFQ